MELKMGSAKPFLKEILHNKRDTINLCNPLSNQSLGKYKQRKSIFSLQDVT